MYPLFEITQASEGWAGPSQDRVKVIHGAGMVIVVVADGAGGMGQGAAAAESVVEHIASTAVSLDKGLMQSETWTGALMTVDQRLSEESAGQSTAVVAVVSAGSVCGASVGDSGAWLVSATARTVLTESQRHKPLLGDGAATPVPFDAHHERRTLLAATDGLFKYAPPDQICDLARQADLKHTASALIDAVRLPSGKLQDDAAVVLCRPGLPIMAHKHSSGHEREILVSERCGCFYCLGIFKPTEIKAWINEKGSVDRTAQCPACGIDSVIGTASGYPITREFLDAMNRAWF